VVAYSIEDTLVTRRRVSYRRFIGGIIRIRPPRGQPLVENIHVP
jgi:hypothetical protein